MILATEKHIKGNEFPGYAPITHYSCQLPISVFRQRQERILLSRTVLGFFLVSFIMASMTLPTSLQKGLDGTKVDYVKLGSSGLQVSVPILGGMSLGSKKFSPWVIEEDEAMEILKAAFDCGINTWDTANMYSNGLSEEIFGKAIQKYKIPRQKLVIMTKCFIHVGEDLEVIGPMHGQWMSQSKDYVNQGGEFPLTLLWPVSESVLIYLRR